MQLAQYMLDVGFDRRLGYQQPGRDLAVMGARGDHGQHLFLARSQVGVGATIVAGTAK